MIGVHLEGSLEEGWEFGGGEGVTPSLRRKIEEGGVPTLSPQRKIEREGGGPPSLIFFNLRGGGPRRAFLTTDYTLGPQEPELSL